MLDDESKGLMDLAAEYIKQIRAGDDETALILMKEFGMLAYQRGWNDHAVDQANARISEMRAR